MLDLCELMHPSDPGVYVRGLYGKRQLDSVYLPVIREIKLLWNRADDRFV